MASAATASGDSEPSWCELTDLASSSVGGCIQFATDEWFAAADRLLLPQPAVFIPEDFTPYGKWMDGWESRRKRIAGHDWCIIKLGLPGQIVGIEIDTAHFTGNHAPRASVQGAYLDPEPEALATLARDWRTDRIGKAATAEQLRLAQSLGSDKWTDLVPFTPLRPGYAESRRHFFAVPAPAAAAAGAAPPPPPAPAFTHLRLNMYPDGGIARLRVRGVVRRDWARVPPRAVLDLAAVENGGVALGCSDRHFGEPRNLILPGRGATMGDGWETARKPTRPAVLQVGADGLVEAPGSDWAVIRLGTAGEISRLVVDTHFFKGNFPESVAVDAAAAAGGNEGDLTALPWRALLPRTKMGPDREHAFEGADLRRVGPVTHLRLTMFPDGGVMRLRAFGTKEAGSRL
ncbi:galactose-binding domain-like protein [Tribonema minus]|uniref:Galactose-binding domain-like protein n=1 Tax=Tribonema minus TaxID=303371 RepID=A0A836C8W1_9STRA|nr:galactose-binding domain-like protein [Tribonema minus]